MEGIKINIKYHPDNNNIVIVELGGYVDQTNCHQVEKTIADIMASNKLNLVFDLRDLVYMSSAGWGIFVGEIKLVRDKGGDIKIAAMSPEVYEVFQMLEFFHIIQDYTSVEDAVNSFQGELVSPESEKAVPKTEKDDQSLEELLEQSGVNAEIENNATEDEIVIDDDEDEDESTASVPEPVIKVEQSAEPADVVENQRPATQSEFKPVDLEAKLDISRLPLSEKIKRVVTNYPLLSIFQLRKMLRHEKFGHTKVGLFKLYRTLRFLNLNSRKKRYRFYRSS